MPDDAGLSPPASSPRLRWAAWFMLAMAPFVDAGLLAGWRAGFLIATPLLAGYFLFSWPRLALNARILLGICVILAVIIVLRPDGYGLMMEACSRLTVLPVFFAMLGLLRAAANASNTVAKAGFFLVNQPVGRRYAALTAGGHIFGILLNIGGLALLLDMTKRANTLEAGGGDPRIVEIRERRMTLAILRGFACIALWSPLGLALNLLVASVPGLSWMDVAPYGFAATIAFMGLGFIFDRVEYPRGTRVLDVPHDPAGRRALFAVIGHVAALSTLTLAAELLTHFSFQTLLINLVPIYACVWLLVIGYRRGEKNPAAYAGRTIYGNGIVRFPAVANEIAVFASSGFLGVALAALIPREGLQAVILAIALPAGLFAALLAFAVFVFGLMGCSPMISAAILASVLANVTVPGLSHATMVLALAGAWACIIGFAPLMSSLVLTAGTIGRKSTEVGLIWNGRFALTAIALWMFALLFIRI